MPRNLRDGPELGHRYRVGDHDRVDGPAGRALAHVRSLARGGPLDPPVRVTVHFHPDRDAGGRSTLQALLDDGVYLSQFATGTSNGGLPAGVGGSVRFGSAHLRLRPEVLARTTFCFPDSAADPDDVGVRERCDLTALADTSGRDVLDDYVEAHVHGGVRLDRDVEALVLDPSFTGETRGFPAPVERHPGFALSRSDFSRPEVRAFRGPEVAAVGASLAAVVDPAVIGAASWTGEHDGQTLKRVWHCVARFGYDGDHGRPGAAEPPLP